MADPLETVSWQLRTTLLNVDRIPLLMGIVNVTPDSFSDGGRHFEVSAAVEHGLRLVSEGADILDIGGQSTRPGATPINANEELRRVLPVVERLASLTDVPISVDTFYSFVARETLAAGAQAINDITALTYDSQMLEIVCETQCGVCIMHMQGNPQTMQIAPNYYNVCEEVAFYLTARRDVLTNAGIPASRIAIDPGIGFGKTNDHNLALLQNLHRLRSLGQPVLVGVSRKAFVGKLMGDTTIDRTFGTIGAALAAATAGASVLRVHDVAAVRQALVVFGAASQPQER
jgi:dihydropteroate synthase